MHLGHIIQSFTLPSASLFSLHSIAQMPFVVSRILEPASPLPRAFWTHRSSVQFQVAYLCCRIPVSQQLQAIPMGCLALSSDITPMQDGLRFQASLPSRNPLHILIYHKSACNKRTCTRCRGCRTIPPVVASVFRPSRTYTISSTYPARWLKALDYYYISCHVQRINTSGDTSWVSSDSCLLWLPCPDWRAHRWCL